ncbi:MAG TPA: hypothetical protein VMM35_00775 [Longimicrobiales bacterium]|nr:hypothetical protein [Longimicrobiales bacterium]
MTEQQGISAKDRRRRESKIWRTGLLVSLLFHLLVFFGWRGNVIPLSPFAAAGPRAGDNRAAAGSMQALNVRTPPPTPVVPPLVPLPTDILIEPVEYEDEVELDPASVLGEAPGLSDAPGLENGTGLGDGGNAEEGFYRLEPPSPRGMIIPPANRDLRGAEVQVWVFVDEVGRVVADSTRLEPPTRDRDFNRRLIREASEWVFRPARQEGRAVASWFPYKISM